MKDKFCRRAASLAVVLLALLTVPVLAAGEGTGTAPMFYETIRSLLPPVVAIILALVTKEVYSSLFLGILTGGLLWSGFSFEGTVTHVFQDGIVSVLSDGYNVGILVFPVILGAMVSLMNRTGGSAVFGRWALRNIETRAGGAAGRHCAGHPDFHSRLFQLPHRGQRDAPGDGQS